MMHHQRPCAESLEPRTLLAAAELVADVNPVTPSSSPVNTVAVGDRVFFWRSLLSGFSGQIYVTDGTAAGTREVWQTDGGYPRLTSGATRAYFFTQNAVYATDGTTAGTKPLVGDLGTLPEFLYTRGDSLWFFARATSSQSNQLYRSDGTPAGTTVVANVPTGHSPLQNIGTGYDHLSPVVSASGLFYYLTSSDNFTKTNLWRSDGTAGGTFIIKSFTVGGVSSTDRVRWQTDVDGTLYFRARTSNQGSSEWDLWKSNGTAAGTGIIRLNVGSDAGEFVNYNGALYFRGFQSSTGYELWRSDASGTSLVKDITPGSASSNFQLTTVVGGVMYFAWGDASFGLPGPQLWRSDGTAAGTMHVTTMPFSIRHITAAGDYVFLSAGELYRTDGTAAGTINIQPPGVPGRVPVEVAGTSSALIFTIDHPVHGRELFRATGAPDGSGLVVDLTPDSYSSNPTGFGTYNGHLYFGAEHTGNGPGLFRSDGTAAGTALVKDGLSEIAYPAVANGLLYFRASDGPRSRELFRTDGTEAGTYFVKDLDTYTTGGGDVRDLTEVMGKVVFLARPYPDSWNVWVSDGTDTGTIKLNSLTVSVSDLNRSKPLWKVGNFVYFTPWDNSPVGSGDELWRTDGTVAGTQIVRDIVPGPASSNPAILGAMNDRLYFAASDESGAGYHLWSTDGTAQGTIKVANASLSPFGEFNTGLAIGNTFYFTTGQSFVGKLWRTDGTEAGTSQIITLNSTIETLGSSGGRLYFSDQALGPNRHDVWVSDGTSAGTRRIHSLQTGGFAEMIDLDGILYFTSGSRLWATDGTGVFQIDNANSPQKLYKFNETIYFSATDTPHGRELWKVASAPIQPAWLSASADAIYQLVGSDLSITAGMVTFTGDASQTHPGLNVTIENGAQLTFAARQRLGTLRLNGTAQARAAASGDNVIFTQTLSMDVGAIFDLNDNDLIVDYTGASTLVATQLLINAARAGGAWTGNGITSTTAKNANPRNATLGVMEAFDFKAIYGAGATFAGEVIDASAVLVKYTFYGDADFNGAVNFDDYSRTDLGFNQGRSGWLNGDFDANGVVDFDDYSLIDLAFNTQGGALRGGQLASSKPHGRSRFI